MTTQFTPSVASARHRPGLDVVRGIAIALVLVFHYHQLTPGGAHTASWWDLVFAQGWVGVDLFFVLSGFLITGILVDARGDGRAVPEGYYRAFYVRRAVRIFPLYYLALAVVAIVPLLAGTARVGALPWHALYATNLLVATRGWGPAGELGHFWSLAVEEQFYLLWPALIAWTPARYRVRMCLAAIAAASLTRVALFAATGLLGRANAGHVIAFVFTGARLDALALGALGALLVRDPALLARWTRHRTWSLSGAAVLVLVAFLSAPAHWDTTVVGQIVGFPAIAYGFLWVVMRASLRTDEPRGIAKGFAHLGTYSYGVYVWHHLVRRPLYAWCVDQVVPWAQAHAALGSALTRWWPALYMVTGCALSIAIAVVSWYVWERWWLALKRYAPMPIPAPSGQERR